MRVADREGDGGGLHFVEGEPDLEPPEELCVEVLDEADLLQDDVDCELVDESDLDLDLADDAFDHLVHDGNEDDDPTTSAEEFLCHGCFQVWPRAVLADPEAVLCRQCVT